ncbi:pyridoxamine 5'-phosphate oxidase family protein [Rugamonas sp.]|uniref:2Fe-2S iron-sulfur cluster-binding protein n=1 Tax=Rugamonas sp. TaxID=1926287 RepID=UPI0025FE7F32|nr:pyridoxamine 5'-phosphate oxidase family protein [Rugamonas sp.]
MSDIESSSVWPEGRPLFHAGELEAQRRVGVADKMERQGRRAMRSLMPDQHRQFFAHLPFIVAGAVDADGQPWATIMTGAPGFVRAPQADLLHIAALPVAGDPLAGVLAPGADIGLLGIELPTRRRNRANGKLVPSAPGTLAVRVHQSFGNCPQYIQGRDWEVAPAPPAGTRPWHGGELDAAALALVAAADTFFIASAHRPPEDAAAAGADVSHRGGKAGFVRIDDARTLTVPDFVGNFYFNTIGNLLLHPRAGLLFIDFERGTMLHVAARAEMIWDGAEVAAYAGAQRLIRFHIERVIRLDHALPLRWSAPSWSPMLERTGSWEAARRGMLAESRRNDWRRFKVAAAVAESATVMSFVLEPDDGGGVAAYRPGQYLPVRVPLAAGGPPLMRTYTLSDAPDGRGYRISVRRQGPASDWLHRHAVRGGTLEVMAPRGDFVFDSDSTRPVVLVSAGVGVTPMLAMLNSLLVNEGRSRHHAPIFFLHGARSRRELAFERHLLDKAARHANLHLHVSFSQPGDGDAAADAHYHAGRVDIDFLKAVLPFDDYDFYLCGPAGFMQGLYDGLRKLNVADERIRFESFGAASVARSRVAKAAEADAGEGVQVTFARSDKTVLWRPADGTLLELAEAQGLSPLFACRSGLCGTCAVRVIDGAVDYSSAPACQAAPDEALICCSRPHAGPHLPDSEHRVGVVLDL